MTNSELIQRFEKLVSVERRVTRKVLEHIAEIDSRRAYLDLGFDGMYAYLTKGLGYSEGAAYRRLQAARVAKDNPVVAEKFEAGVLNLTQLADVAKASRQTRKKPDAAFFVQLESQSKAATQQMIAKAFELPIQTDVRQCIQQDHSVRLELTFTAEEFAALENARSLLSHICPDGAWPQVLVELAKQYSKRFEVKSSSSKSAATPRKLAQPISENSGRARPQLRFQRSKSQISPQPPEALWAPPARRRRGIAGSVRKLVFAQAKGGCQFFDPKTGRRCGSTYQPQVDHVHPVSRGGHNDLTNLQLLCGSHNRAKGGG